MTELTPVNGVTYALYGDPAYPQSIYLFGGYWHPPAGSPHALWNTLMSKVREVVEWSYNQIVQHWKYLGFKSSMKIFEVLVSRYYVIGAFLANLITTFYDNRINVYFECDAMKLNEYLNLADSN